jgi:hypothetical protein
MILLIILIFLVIFLSSIAYAIFDESEDAALGVGIISLIAAMVVLIYFGCNVPQHWELIEESELVALQDNITTQGSFFLGSGSVDGELKYFFYEKSGQGFKSRSVHSDGVILVESDEARYQEWLKKDDKWWYWVFVLSGSEQKKIIKIPKGTILSNYNLDLKN